MAKSNHHLRSTSLPSASHPLTAKVEEELNRLRGWVALKSCSLNTAEVLEDGICGLTGLYESVEDLLQLPCTRRVLSHNRDQSCVDSALEGTVRVLDVTGSTRDVLLQMKEYVQRSQSDLRRRGGQDCALGSRTDDYISSSRKLSKLIHKYLGEFRKAESELQENEQVLAAVVTVLRQVEAITLHVYESLLNFMLGSKASRKQSSWSFVSKLFHNKRIRCELQDDVCNEVDMAQIALLVLRSCKLPEATVVQHAERQLEVLEVTMGNLEERLESMFKTIIKTRVTLLNVLSN